MRDQAGSSGDAKISAKSLAHLEDILIDLQMRLPDSRFIELLSAVRACRLVVELWESGNVIAADLMPGAHAALKHVQATVQIMAGELRKTADDRR